MRARQILIAAIVVLTAARAAIVWLEQPSPAEAYYFLCAEHPAPAYFDGPAGTAFVVGLVDKIGKSDVLWRLTSPLWALAATGACFFLIRRLGDESVAAWTALVMNALPIFNAAALRVGPELPALGFALLGIYCIWRAYEEENGVLWWFAGGGLCLGLAACFMYVTIALAPVLAVFVLCKSKHWRGVDIGGLLVFLLVSGLCLAPALVWNARQNWIPIAGGTFRTLWEFDGMGFLHAMGQLNAAFSPLILIALFGAWVAAGRGSSLHLRSRFVFLCALPGLLLGLYFALRGRDAVFCVLLAAPVLIFKALTALTSRPFAKPLAWAAVVLSTLMSLQMAAGAYLAGRNWSEVAAQVRGIFLEKSVQGEEGLFLIAQDEALASIIGYHLRGDLIPPAGHPAVYVRESQAMTSQFALWPGYDDFIETEKPHDEYFTEQKGENPFTGRSALYISREPPGDLPQAIKAAFESVTQLGQIPLSPGEPLYIYYCLSYQTLPL